MINRCHSLAVHKADELVLIDLFSRQVGFRKHESIPYNTNYNQVLGIRFQVSGFRFQVLGIRFHVAGIRFQVSGVRFWLSGFRCVLIFTGKLLKAYNLQPIT